MPQLTDLGFHLALIDDLQQHALGAYLMKACPLQGQRVCIRPSICCCWPAVAS